MDVEKQEPTGDRPRDDPHPEVEFPFYQSCNSIDSDPDEESHNYCVQTTILVPKRIGKCSIEKH